MKDRLTLFLAYLDIGQVKFEEIVGLSRGFVNKVGDSIREANLKKITDAYPELNTNWLKTGEGEMLKPSYVNQSNLVGDNIHGTHVTVTKGQIDKGTGHKITNSDISAIKEVMTPIVSLMEKKDEQVSDVITMLKSKDVQVSEMIGILKSKDEQINRLIGLVEKHGQ